MGFEPTTLTCNFPRPHWMLWLWAQTPLRSSVAKPPVEQYIDVGLRTGWLDSAEATVERPSVPQSGRNR